MGKSDNEPSREQVRLGLLALHDRKFFARLLENPREAMKAVVAEGKLHLTEADMAQVEKLIKTHLTARPDKDPMVMFDKYRKTGIFNGEGDWAELWKIDR